MGSFSEPQLVLSGNGLFQLVVKGTDTVSKAVKMQAIADGFQKNLTTPSFAVAEKYASCAEKRVQSAIFSLRKTYMDSFSLDGVEGLKSPPRGLSYLPYQTAAIEFARKRPHVLIGDEAGLGKTVEVAGIINEISPLSVLIVCPASLRLNWQRELQKWCRDLPERLDIVSYDSIWRKDTYEKLPDRFDLMVLDEAHYVKNKDSKRSLACVARSMNATRVVALTGTPLKNRVIDIWNILHILCPSLFPDLTAFAMRYCGAFIQRIPLGHGRFKSVWNTNGSSNERELQEVLRSTVMIRRLKKDALPQLPKKRRQIIPLVPGKGILDEEKRAWDKLVNELGYEKAVERLQTGEKVGLSEMARIRQQVALSKVPDVVSHVTDLLENVEKVIVFAHHRAVVDALFKGLSAFSPVKVVGGMTDAKKQESVDSFQNDPGTRVFIGNIQAAGTGLTLTASSTVVFAELSFVPSDMSQAEDRACRIGAKDDSILVQHLVLEGSLDSHMVQLVVEKQEIMDLVLDI